MNITPHTVSLPLATVVNPPTEGLRRENNQREIITQVSATNPSLAEKGVASDKERARTPAQTNEAVDFANLRKQSENAANSIADQQSGQGEQNSQENPEEQQGKPQNNTRDTSPEENRDEERANERVIGQLVQRDQEVRTHELAHATTGGSITGSPSYTFEVGPDGKKYAVSGEVSVDLSSVAGDPQATITKMQKVHAAALAPANPSSQDIRVAANAAQKILSAQSELLAQKKDVVDESNQSKASHDIGTRSTFHNDTTNNDFDTLMDRTLAAQENIIANPPTKANNSSIQSHEVQQRSHRIENFYFQISQGYEKPDNFQFELTA